ncbi:hypothetical protein PENTCL1PPCAC_12254, partial [Pristionchus entomophagus]
LKMDPVEAGEWLGSRPQQLILLTGIDAANRPGHAALLNALMNRSADRAPLNMRVISGELVLPAKEARPRERGVLRREWPLKYTQKVPALIVLFMALEWDDASWNEKKSEAESKVESIRAAASRHGSRLALVLLQERSLPHPDEIATERAAELCSQCQLSPKQLFVLPTSGDLQGYVSKLESALHELAQGFYQQKIKTIRARSIPNNSVPLVVRQMFKLAFLSELKQDTHTALRNYKLAYEQCRDHQDAWETIDLFEWRSVVGLLNYKMCDLCFLHSTALEAITQMRRHQQLFFNSNPGVYPTAQLASIEYELWKSKQCWHFAELFERAVVAGLTAVPTLNPGTHLDAAAAHFSRANKEIAALKTAMQQLQQEGAAAPAYPTPDPLAPITVFFGQRPWRVGYEAAAPVSIEQEAVVALQQRLRVNSEGVCALLSGAMGQYKKYGCYNMQRKMLGEMADEYAAAGDWQRALQLLQIVGREQLPLRVRAVVGAKALRAAWLVADARAYVAALAHAAATEYEMRNESLSSPSSDPSLMSALNDILSSRVPPPPDGVSPSDGAVAKARLDWERTLAEPVFFSIPSPPPSRSIPQLVALSAAFLPLDRVIEDTAPPQAAGFAWATRADARVPLRVTLRLHADAALEVTRVRVAVDIGGKRRAADEKTPWEMVKEKVLLDPSVDNHLTFVVNLAEHPVPEGCNVVISRVLLELGADRARLTGVFEADGGGLPLAVQGGYAAIRIASRGPAIRAEGARHIECLTAEVVSLPLKLTNVSNGVLRNVRMEFKRPPPSQSAVGMAVLFVDETGQLQADLAAPVKEEMGKGETVDFTLKLSATMMGTIEQLPIEATFDGKTAGSRESCLLPISVESKAPFSVTSSLLNMNGVPVASLLNHNDHLLKVDVTAHATIVVTKCEWLLPDFLKPKDGDELQQLQDELTEGEIISYVCVVEAAEGRAATAAAVGAAAAAAGLQVPEGNMSSASSTSSMTSSAYSTTSGVIPSGVSSASTTTSSLERALGRVSLEWRRPVSSLTAVRSVIPLSSAPLAACPLSIRVRVAPSARPPAPGEAAAGAFAAPTAGARCTAGAPIGIEYEVRNHHDEPVSAQCAVEVPDAFLFSGKRQSSLMLLPGGIEKLSVVVMAQSAGRLPFPRLILRSAAFPDTVLTEANRALPANIFTLPMAKEATVSTA